MQLNDEYYYCFSCGAHGDVVDLAAKLLALPKMQAVQKLMHDFEIDEEYEEEPSAAVENIALTAKVIKNTLLDLWATLCIGYRNYKPLPDDEAPHERYVLACHYLEYLDYLFDLLKYDRQEIVYELDLIVTLEEHVYEQFYQ